MARQPTFTTPETPAGQDVWQRWGPIFHYGFWAVLAITTLLAALDGALSAPQRLAAAGLGLGFGLWHWRLVASAPDVYCDTRRAMLYLTGAGVFFVALTSLHPVFMFPAFFFYAQLFMLLPVKLSILLSGPLTLLIWWRGAVTEGNEFGLSGTMVFTVILIWVPTAVMALFIARIIAQSHQRRELIEELATTRDELALAERQAGIVEERQRLAREIHDTLAQGFASIVLHLEAAEAALPPGHTTAHQHLDQARRTARDSLGEARRLVWALRPASLDDSSLAQALTRLAARWSEETGVPARFVLAEAAAELHPEIEVTLLRAAQEGLANARKHARASAVTLTLTIMSDLVTLDIQDNGVGFAPDAAPAPEAGGGGFGLTSLRERVERLNGTLAVESTPGGGTTIAVALPTVIAGASDQPVPIEPESPVGNHASIGVAP